MTFSGDYTIDQTTNTRFNLFVMRKQMLVLSVLVFILVTVALFIVRLVRGQDLGLAVWRSLFAGALAALVMCLASYLLLKRRIARLYSEGKLQNIRLHVELSEKGLLTDLGEKGSNLVPFAEMLSISETTNAFYFFLNGHIANLIPKDQFEKQEDTNTIRAILHAYIAPEKLHLLH